MKIFPEPPKGSRHPKIYLFKSAPNGKWYFDSKQQWYKITEKQLVTHEDFIQPEGDHVLIERPEIGSRVWLRGLPIKVGPASHLGMVLDGVFIYNKEIIEMIERLELFYS
jgi:hypothetical protein